MTEKGPQWRLDYYYREDGTKPVETFLLTLKRSRLHEFKKILAKFDLFEKLGLQGAIEARLVEAMRGRKGILELRVKGTGFRCYCFTWHDPKGEFRYLLAATAEEKDDRKADERLISEAEAARDDWYRRFG